MKKSICAGLAGALFGLWLAGCGGGKLDQASEQTPPHPTPASNLGSDGPNDGHELPLKTSGLNGVEELTRGLAAAVTPEAAKDYEAGFRKTFTADASKRDYLAAVHDLERALAADSTYAQAHRALGYARFNLGFDVDGAMYHYQRAVELEPDYGEAHYALAFLFAMGNREEGAKHFQKAMELGVPDESKLGERFYPEADKS